MKRPDEELLTQISRIECTVAQLYERPPDAPIDRYEVRNQKTEDMGGGSVCAILEVYLPDYDALVYPTANNESITILPYDLGSDFAFDLAERGYENILAGDWMVDEMTDTEDFGPWKEIAAHLIQYSVGIGILDKLPFRVQHIPDTVQDMQSMSERQRLEFYQILGQKEREAGVAPADRVTEHSSGCYLPKDHLNDEAMVERAAFLFRREAEQTQLAERESILAKVDGSYEALVRDWKTMPAEHLIEISGTITSARHVRQSLHRAHDFQLQFLARFKDPFHVVWHTAKEQGLAIHTDAFDCIVQAVTTGRTAIDLAVYDLEPAFQALEHYDWPGAAKTPQMEGL